EAGEAAWNMAVDETLAESCRLRLSPPTLRFYTWRRPAFTIGRFQNAMDEFDLEACRLEGIPVVRRITGGRAVYHDRDLAYSLAAAAGDPVLPDSLQGAFLAVRRGLMEGLRRLDLKADPQRYHPRRRRRSPLCFSSTTRHEISVDGAKILGSAQRRWKDGFLQQGAFSMMQNGNASANRFLRKQNPGMRTGGETAQRGGFGPDSSDRIELNRATVSKHLAAGLETVLGISFKPDSLTPREMEWSLRLMATKYAQDDWNIHQNENPTNNIPSASPLIDKLENSVSIEM
ncbi:MAG TPA: biotin/lipoate A/B protein ligase family protein, partial [Nitrospiria bacterium]